MSESSKVKRRTSGFTRAVREARPKLIRVATAMVGANDAEDVVQRALLKAWRLSQSPPDNWESWLFRCTVNMAKDALQERRQGPEVLSTDAILDKEADTGGGD